MTHDNDDFTATDIAGWLGPQPEPAPANQEDGAGHIVARIRAALQAMRDRHRLRRELEVLDSEGDLDRILADAQLSRGDIEPLLENYPASAHRLDDMAARLNVADALHRDPATERDMQHLCSVCQEMGRCRRWLDSGATEGFQEFCPNAAALEALRHDKA